LTDKETSILLFITIKQAKNVTIYRWFQTINDVLLNLFLFIKESTTILNSTTVFNIDDNLEKQIIIRMISEGSCDIEDYIEVLMLKI